MYLIMQLVHLCDAVAEDQSAALKIVGDALSVSGCHLSVSGCHNQVPHQRNLLLLTVTAHAAIMNALDQQAWIAMPGLPGLLVKSIHYCSMSCDSEELWTAIVHSHLHNV